MRTKLPIVAFGGDGQVVPLPLTPFPEEPPVFTNFGSQQIRLIHAPIPPETRESPTATQILSSQYAKFVDEEPQRFWIYQYRNAVDKPWNSFYEFGDLEFFPPDFEVMNHFTSTYPTTPNFQVSTVLIVKFFLEEEAGLGSMEGDYKARKVAGKIMLVNGDVKRNNGGRTVTILSCKNEEERVRAIKGYFGIDLIEIEARGIQGRACELIVNSQGEDSALR
ncbi:hypothetical protein HYFRA_00009189 [Hymenoscyphus fraxineus]|uniref:Arylamine N-acetyltransferase n=1 Tax=Hymenoscyphus fraxineus TaxID=746836 RepID=A0A9N9KUQ3_9HELO|nr:hypothetical protein HYFRA_00009189 [Hymenoscyphus fraxineus]